MWKKRFKSMGLLRAIVGCADGTYGTYRLVGVVVAVVAVAQFSKKSPPPAPERAVGGTYRCYWYVQYVQTVAVRTGSTGTYGTYRRLRYVQVLSARMAHLVPLTTGLCSCARRTSSEAAVIDLDGLDGDTRRKSRRGEVEVGEGKEREGKLFLVKPCLY